MCLCLGQGRFSPYRAVEKGREDRATEPTFEGVWHALLPHRVWSAGESLRGATWLVRPPSQPGAAQQQHTWSAKVRKKKRSSFLFRGSSSSLNPEQDHRCASYSHTAQDSSCPKGCQLTRDGQKKPTQGGVILSTAPFIWLPVQTPASALHSPGQKKAEPTPKRGKTWRYILGKQFLSVRDVQYPDEGENWSVHYSVKMKSFHLGRGSPAMHLSRSAEIRHRGWKSTLPSWCSDDSVSGFSVKSGNMRTKCHLLLWWFNSSEVR